MLGVFLDKETVDLGDIDFSALDNSLKKFQHYPATRPEQVVERIAHAQVVISNKVLNGQPLRVVV